MPRITRAALRLLENEQINRPDVAATGAENVTMLGYDQGENLVAGLSKPTEGLQGEELKAAKKRSVRASEKSKDLAFAPEESILPLTETRANSSVISARVSAAGVSQEVTTLASASEDILALRVINPRSVKTAETTDPIAEMDALQEAITEVEQDLCSSMSSSPPKPNEKLDFHIRTQTTTSSATKLPSPETGLKNSADNLTSMKVASPEKYEPAADDGVALTTADQHFCKSALPIDQPNVEGQAIPLYKRKPFVPKKSTRPPLTTNFVLPGEVFAAKLKAAKEEQNVQGESVSKSSPKSFTTKRHSSNAPKSDSSKPQHTVSKKNIREPVRPSFVLPGELVAAKLKVAKAEREARAEVASKAAAKPPRSGPRPSLGFTPAAGRRTSMAARSTASSSTQKPVAPTPEAPPETRSHVSTQKTLKASHSRPSVTHLSRGTIIQEQGRAEALRRTRAEAAERGRLASKLWAEKQLARRNHQRKSTDAATQAVSK